MSVHHIDEATLDEWLKTPRWQRYASSSGHGSNKTFEVDDGKVFKVTDHDEVVFIGSSRKMAIEAYNEAP